ncbi:MAG: hypothetical protein OXC40_03140 [Proteobacteria bacterium]|nr:hypothetical protein [Pseudomonadota bacterium]
MDYLNLTELPQQQDEPIENLDDPQLDTVVRSNIQQALTVMLLAPVIGNNLRLSCQNPIVYPRRLKNL